MATAAVPGFSIDLKSHTTLPIRLGKSISKPPSGSQWTSVRYNHKPVLKRTERVKCSIKPSRGSGKWELALQEEGDSYTYSGKEETDDQSYVLICQGKDDNREMVLERAGRGFSFNLTKTPWESSTAKLAAKYPPLPTHEDVVDDVSGDEDVEEPPDDSNPFDYRHFLKAELEKPETTNPKLDAPHSATGTPIIRPQTTPKPAKRVEAKTSTVKKRKATAAEKSNPKRVKAGVEPPSRRDSSKPKPTATEVPKLRLDRRASTRRQSLDDSGELILENETPIDDKPSKHSSAMALALSGALRNGPISLRSAVSSPASQVASPMPPRPEGMDEEYEFDLGGDSAEDDREMPAPPRGQAKKGAGGNKTFDDDDAEDDFEPSRPAQTHKSTAASTASVAGDGGDDDDDLDKQLALAMAEDDEAGNANLAGSPDSDEESEEE